MNNNRARLLAILLLATALGAAAQETQRPSQPPARAGAAETLGPYVDGVVRGFIRDKDLTGLTLAVVHDNRPAMVEGYGLADMASGRGVDGEDTLFRIGSISKTFTWTAAMMLVARGELDLDTDVNEYLEEVEIGEAFGEPVTMNHLMAHRAGFEDTLEVFTVPDDDPRSLAEVLAEHQPERVYPPGARTSYSNWGAALAAQVVANVAGMPYDAFLRSEILDPLGMHSTTLLPPSQMPEALRERLATGHTFKGGRHVAADVMQIGAYAPAGAMASTAADMSRWMRFHLNGGELGGVQLMSDTTHERMWTRAFDDRGESAGLAHGFQVTHYNDLKTVGHAGSTGYFNSSMIMVPELDLGIFASQNTSKGHYDAVGTLPLLVIDHWTGRPASPAPAPPDNGDRPALAEYAGGYVNNRRSFTTMTAVYGASPSLTVEPADDGGLIVTEGGETRRYYPVAGSKDVFENRFGERLAFQRDEQGEIVAAYDNSGVHSHERLGGFGAPQALYASAGVAVLLALTTLLGFWRRWRLVPETTRAGRQAATAAFVAAVIVLVFLGITAATLVAASSMTGADLVDYPPLGMIAMSYAAWALAAAAVLALVAAVVAWRGSDWGWWRKTHFSLFALALTFLALQLWHWNVFGAPYI